MKNIVGMGRMKNEKMLIAGAVIVILLLFLCLYKPPGNQSSQKDLINANLSNVSKAYNASNTPNSSNANAQNISSNDSNTQEAPKKIIIGIPEHVHADFKVFLDGKQVNFSQEKYMYDPNDPRKAPMHMHDLNGGVIHKELTGTTLAYFFSTLNMTFNSTCFALDDGSTFCNGNNKTLKLFIKHDGGNWERNMEMGDCELLDLDKALITYGAENEAVIKQQEDSVTDEACIFSNKCPQRGSSGE